MSTYNALNVSISAGIEGTALSFTKEVCTLDATRKKATINATGKRFISPNVPVRVYIGADTESAVELPESYYTFYHAGGHVEIINPVPEHDYVFISGSYLPFAIVGEVRNFSLDNLFEVKDVSAISPTASRWKKQKALLQDGSVTLSGFYDTAVLNYLRPDADDLICFVEIKLDGVFVWQAIGLLQRFGIGASVNDMVSNDRSINTTGPVWYSKL